MDIVFYIKKFLGNFSHNRIEIVRKWVNIGMPLVSYYAKQQLDTMINLLDGVTLVQRKSMAEEHRGLVIKDTSLVFIIQKNLEATNSQAF